MTRTLGALAILMTIALGAILAPEAATADRRSGPPPVVLTNGDRQVRLPASSYCWTETTPDGSVGECADGILVPFKDLKHAGVQPQVHFSFASTGWHFKASMSTHGAGCTAHPTVVRTNDRRFVLRPHAHGGCTWRVDMFGRGPQGDLAVSFRWHPGRTT